MVGCESYPDCSRRRIDLKLLPARVRHNWLVEGGQAATRLELDPYRLFLVMVFAGMGIVTLSMLAIAVWLFRRNRRLPRLVKPKRR